MKEVPSLTVLPKELLIFDQIDPLRMPLVDKFYQSQGYRIKCGRNERVFTLSHPRDGIFAVARLIPVLDDFWLRNLLVAKAWRAQGLGKFLMQKLVLQLGSADCYCFALTHLEQFYLSLDFQHVKPEQGNVNIAQRYQKYRASGRDWLFMGRCNRIGYQESYDFHPSVL